MRDDGFVAGYQTHTLQLRRWRAVQSHTGAWNVIGYVGTPDCDYIEWCHGEEWEPAEFGGELLAVMFANHLNTKQDAETYEYNEWRD